MKITIAQLLLLLLSLSSCHEDPKQRLFEQEKEAQKREIIYNRINKSWNFNTQPINATARTLTSNWNEWRIFLSELGQKPKSSLGAFQQKAKTLTKRISDLNNNIPINYNVPEVKSRIAAIETKINSINLYIHLNQIPDKKIVLLIMETNIELAAFQQQLEEIVVKKQIKMEEGESDMLRMLDTTRAIPTSNQNIKIIR
jgi:hypothetical protein